MKKQAFSSVLMAESGSLRKPQKLLLSQSDMATANAAEAAVVAAQQLMQLSDEDNNSSEKSSNVQKKKKSLDDGEEEDYIESKEKMSCAKKIEEIFGKEQEKEIYQTKKRRYRTLVNLYRSTKPMSFDMYRRKMRY